MPRRAREHNRGPAAAADNRVALLAAARSLFSERGFHVPMSAIAAQAGVGQGVLYRHFPTRFDLAFAVFEQNFAELERLAAVDDDGAFFGVWDLLLQQTITDTAFVEMIIDARRKLPTYDGGDRIRALLTPVLARAQTAGLLDSGIGVEDVLLAQRMAYGLVVTSIDESWTPQRIDGVLLNAAWAGVVAHPVSTELTAVPAKVD